MKKGLQCARPFVTLTGATFRASERLVFRRTNWTLGAHEQWAVIGPNASGKSLLASALEGALPLVEGELDYHFPTKPGESPEQRVACISFEQQRGLAGDSLAAARWFSLEQEESAAVEDLLSFDSVEEINPFAVADHRAARVSFARRRAGVIRTLGLSALLTRRLVQLSNGEMRKILLARVLLRQPRLLILDDPMAGLDAAYRARMQRIIAALARRRDMRVLLMISRAEDLSPAVTHIALLKECRIVAHGPRAAMLRDPRVTSLLAAPRLRRSKTQPRRAPGRELVRLENVSMAFEARVVFRDLTWTVREGESWALVGPNGAGKSALLSLIAGNVLPASADAFVLFGRSRGTGESRAWVRRHVGEVSPEQHLHFDVEQTALEAVLTGFTDALVFQGRCGTRQRREALKWLRRFGLSREAARPMNRLSAGRQRMVLLARALVRKPMLLLLDEASQGLDARNRRIFLNEVQELVHQGRATVLFTTHRVDEIPPAIRRRLTLKKGRAFLSRQ